MDFILLFIPFLALDDKGGVKMPFMYSFGHVSPCIELMSFPFRFELPRSFVRTMWCENICNVCYFVPRCVTYLCSKEFLLVCDIFELCNYLFFCVLVQKGRILRATGRILRIPWPESLGSYPESPGPAVEHSFFEWISCHMHHTCLCTHLFTPL